MFKYILFISVFIILFGSVAYSQNDSSINYGVQVDFTSLIFINNLSVVGNLDLLKLTEDSHAGFRLGFDYYSAGTPGGSENGSPFIDIDALGKISVYGKVMEVNFCPGLTLHNTTGRQNDNGVFIKVAGDIKFKVYKNFAGFLIKFALSKQSYGGVGIFLGYNSKDF